MRAQSYTYWIGFAMKEGDRDDASHLQPTSKKGKERRWFRQSKRKIRESSKLQARGSPMEIYVGIGGGVMRTPDKDPIRRSNRSHYGELNATTSPAITTLEKLRYGSGDLNRKGVIEDRFPRELR
ncbi:hypothetical protein L6452_42802 [Arctium lappa]|uniref:Uncharacterized protein n=1 Tax=Arctium lappa TaxID=4217 RepID=A0ACB8XJA6_ARCLA|nr:hypothetical protein L6452_42802 [Arctium lappa]